MADSPPLRRRLAGLKPEELLAQGLAVPDGGEPWSVPGIVLEIPLGRGGMGTVYRARQVSLDREVAVKLLAPELARDPLFLERLAREARVMARLRHANLVTVYDFHRTEDQAALVMEFVAGGTLRTRLHEHPQGLPLAEALSLLRQIAAGLQAAHEAGVIHRDLKPENVLLDALGKARVTDFGLAIPAGDEAARLTLTGTTLGTRDYMAPEQWKPGEIDARVDIFALGVVAYELLTGQIPRGSFEPPQRLRPEVPRRVSEVVMRALKPAAADRPPNLASFLAALDSVGRVGWRRWWIGAAAAAVVLGGAAVWWNEREARAPTLLTVEAAEAAWRDAIAGTRIYDDVISGDWRHENGVLTSDAQICVIGLEREMPPAYDVRVRFTRLGGRDSIAIFFHANGAMASAELDAWREGLAGVQSIGSETLRNGYGFRHSLVNGQPCELLLEVRPGRVRMSVDGVLRKEFAIGTQPLGIVSEWQWRSAERPAALAIGSYLSPTRFERVEWRAVAEPADAGP